MIYQQRALDINTRELRLDHPDTMKSYRDLRSHMLNTGTQAVGYKEGDKGRLFWLGKVFPLTLGVAIRYVMVLGPQVDDCEALGEGFGDQEVFYGLKDSEEKNGENIMQTQSTDSSEDREPFGEVDLIGRYGRYPKLLGSNTVKNVYRGFDLEEGRDIAWNQVKLRNFTGVQDSKKNQLNFITEACVSGNLRNYRKKHKRVSLKALKKWSRQILKGLDYLHTHEPRDIHRDLICSNIFINGSIGKNGLLVFPVALAIFAYECFKLYKESKKRNSTGNPESVCEDLIYWIAAHLIKMDLLKAMARKSTNAAISHTTHVILLTLKELMMATMVISGTRAEKQNVKLWHAMAWG
ncbi:probable serine/threonine-protein kinase WNK11 [Tanacetum coccineum]|uniref:non-specific serine/threonine protein kinase n=1 Tax=Tanacetum coccineum TaxID=301880 RepID=A0ABQ5HGC7_9ASTR